MLSLIFMRNKILVSKETVVLNRWESETLRRWDSVSPSSERIIHSDEGLTLETSAFQIFLGGSSTFANTFVKTKFS